MGTPQVHAVFNLLKSYTLLDGIVIAANLEKQLLIIADTPSGWEGVVRCSVKM
jgi:hypothetical protein